MKKLNCFQLVILKQNPSGVALMTVDSWEKHKRNILKSFAEETSQEESIELYDHYLSKFSVSKGDQKVIDDLIKFHNIEINTTPDFLSFSGDFHYF